jgi:hypothetical protein
MSGQLVGKQEKRVGKAVNMLKKMQNPFALVFQGFLVGGLLFWTTQGDAAPRPHAAAPSSIVATR